jgi:hypothetical protein
MAVSQKSNGNKMSSAVDLFASLDLLIRQGKQGEARQILLDTKLKKIPRPQIAEFADIARRLNMPRLMLVLLKPIIHSEKLGEPPATVRERALYATGLSRLGVFTEAQNILRKLESNKNPEVLLFTAQNLMLQWDYFGAIPKLKKYVQREDISQYQKHVGQVNLVSCLIGDMRWSHANALLDALNTELASLSRQQSSEAESYTLLHANVLGLWAHAAFLQGDLEKSHRAVQQAGQMLSGSRSRYELLAKKWQAVVDLFQNPQSQRAQDEFARLKAEAFKARDWETFRDFEFYEALSRRDDNLFIRLYHGTPYASFRKRIKKIYQPSKQIPKMIQWQIQDLSSPMVSGQIPADRIFDLTRGGEAGNPATLFDQPLLFRLLQFLTKDFYRPVSLGSVFSALYPNEKFNPHSSSNRVHLVVKRLRKWFVVHQIPLDIEVENEFFHLKSHEPYTLRVSFQNFSVSKNDILLESAQAQFAQKGFSQQELREGLALSLKQTRQFVTWAIQRRKMRQLRRGRTISLQLISF